MAEHLSGIYQAQRETETQAERQTDRQGQRKEGWGDSSVVKGSCYTQRLAFDAENPHGGGRKVLTP